MAEEDGLRGLEICTIHWLCIYLVWDWHTLVFCWDKWQIDRGEDCPILLLSSGIAAILPWHLRRCCVSPWNMPWPASCSWLSLRPTQNMVLFPVTRPTHHLICDKCFYYTSCEETFICFPPTKNPKMSHCWNKMIYLTLKFNKIYTIVYSFTKCSLSKFWTISSDQTASCIKSNSNVTHKYHDRIFNLSTFSGCCQWQTH